LLGGVFCEIGEGRNRGFKGVLGVFGEVLVLEGISGGVKKVAKNGFNG